MDFWSYGMGLDDGFGSAGGYGGDDMGGCCGCIVSLILIVVFLWFAISIGKFFLGFIF